MIILNFFLLCFLIFLLLFKQKKKDDDYDYDYDYDYDKYNDKYNDNNNDKYKYNYKYKHDDIIENLEIIQNNNKLPIKINNYNIEVDRPVFSCSNYKNDKAIDLNNIDEDLINITYDKLVNDNKIHNIDYDNMSFYNSNDNYYDIKNNDNYGYTDFMTFKK
jgi:hypothetical protein